MKLLVTGASGSVGSQVARAASENGHSVRCLARPSSNLELLRGLPIETALGDIVDREATAHAVRGVDAVVHCAATTSETAPDLDVSRRTNVEGTKHLLDACQQHGVRKFIFVSSQSANPHNTSVYGKTKLEAERAVAESNLEFTNIRPSLVYGVGSRGLFAKMSRFVARLPVIPMIGDGSQRFRPIYAGCLASAILACLHAPKAVRNTYDLGGADGISFAQFVDGICEILGKKRIKLALPIPLCFGIARGLSLVARNPPLTVDNVTGMTQMSECDISRAQKDFSFRPLSFRQGLELLRQQGVLSQGASDLQSATGSKPQA